VPLIIKEDVISEKYLKKYCNGEIDPEDLANIFFKTATILSKDNEKYEYLVYPNRPREHEIKMVMIDILSEMGFYQMIERPINIPKKPGGKNDTTGFVDISIYTNKGMIDIELKESPSIRKNKYESKKARRDRLDFPKFLSSASTGCSVFYFFRGDDVTRQFDIILKRYRSAYNDVYEDFEKRNLMKDKWFLFFLFAYKEHRIFSTLYRNIHEINFDHVRYNEKEMM
jgi:hypothetical protein